MLGSTQDWTTYESIHSQTNKDPPLKYYATKVTPVKILRPYTSAISSLLGQISLKYMLFPSFPVPIGSFSKSMLTCKHKTKASQVHICPKKKKMQELCTSYFPPKELKLKHFFPHQIWMQNSNHSERGINKIKLPGFSYQLNGQRVAESDPYRLRNKPCLD